MIKSLLLILLIVFAVGGICEFVYILKMLFYFPNIRMNNYVLLVLQSGYALKQLNYIWQKIKWYGDEFAVGIVAVTDDIDVKELLTCKNFAKDKNIVLCKSELISSCTNINGSL